MGRLIIIGRPSGKKGKMVSDADLDEIENTAREAPRKRNKVGMQRELEALSRDELVGFKEDWNEEASERKARKIQYRTKTQWVSTADYNTRGIFKKTEKDFCDCLEQDCPGCHFPCVTCTSRKCGHLCRNNRKWTYTCIEVEGSDLKIENQHL